MKHLVHTLAGLVLKTPLPFWGVLLLLGSMTLPAAAQQTGTDDYLPARLVVKLKADVSVQNAGELADLPALRAYWDSLGVSQAYRKFPTAKAPHAEGHPKQVDLTRTWELHYTAAVDPLEAGWFLSRSKAVEYAEPHFVQTPFYVPDDYDSFAQHGLNLADFEQAWDITRGDTGVTIYITETAVQWQHPDLVNNIQYNLDDPIDGIDNDNDGYVDNYQGWDFVGVDESNWQPDNNPGLEGNPNVSFLEHGTFVTGYSSAQTDNNLGYSGGGFNCRFIPLKCSADEDSAGSARILSGYEAIVYAADDPTTARSKKIINCSWGGNNNSRTAQDAIRYAIYNQDALVVAAAGNNFALQEFYPAAFPEVLSVGATDYDSKFVTTYNEQVDLALYGKGYTTEYPDTFGQLPGIYTSFAAPQVSAAAALVRSHFPGDNALRVAERLRVLSTDISGVTGNASIADFIGKGRLNAFDALTANSPAIRIDTFYFQGSTQGQPNQDDTLELTLIARNYLQSTNGLRLTLTMPDTTWATIVPSALRVYGVVPSLGTRGAQVTPFRIRLKPGAPDNLELTVRVEFADFGSTYRDWQFIDLLINPSFLNQETSNLNHMVNALGSLAFNDYGANTEGVGVTLGGRNHAFEAGFLVANRAGDVRNTLRKPNQVADTGWSSLSSPQAIGINNGLAIRTAFTDSH